MSFHSSNFSSLINDEQKSFWGGGDLTDRDTRNYTLCLIVFHETMNKCDVRIVMLNNSQRVFVQQTWNGGTLDL